MDEQEQVLAETDNFTIWSLVEDGETVYHVELGSLTLHLTSEEWDEFVVLVKEADQN